MLTHRGTVVLSMGMGSCIWVSWAGFPISVCANVSFYKVLSTGAGSCIWASWAGLPHVDCANVTCRLKVSPRLWAWGHVTPTWYYLSIFIAISHIHTPMYIYTSICIHTIIYNIYICVYSVQLLATSGDVGPKL